MRYTIVINQKAMYDNKLFIPVEDYIVLDYMYWLCSSPSKEVDKMRKDYNWERYTWFNFKHFIKETPIISKNNKSSISRKVQRLEDAWYIKSFNDEKTCKKYVLILPVTDMFFREKIEGVAEMQQGCCKNETDPLQKCNIDNINIDNYNNITSISCNSSEEDLLAMNLTQLDLPIASQLVKTNTVPKSVSNKKKSKVEPSEEEKILNGKITSVLKYFNEKNPGVGYANKTHRNSIKTLLQSYSVETIKEMVDKSFEINGQDYAPIITNPYELINKLPKLELFLAKQRKSNW